MTLQNYWYGTLWLGERKRGSELMLKIGLNFWHNPLYVLPSCWKLWIWIFFWTFQMATCHSIVGRWLETTWVTRVAPFLEELPSKEALKRTTDPVKRLHLSRKGSKFEFEFQFWIVNLEFERISAPLIMLKRLYGCPHHWMANYENALFLFHNSCWTSSSKNAELYCCNRSLTNSNLKFEFEIEEDNEK